MIKIYVITNKINKKQYVGLTSRSLKQRWGEHCHEFNNSIIAKAISKYGKENFSTKILHKTDTTEQALDIESKFIKKLKSLVPNGYNLVEYGSGVNAGFKRQEEFKIKASKSKKALWKTTLYRKKQEAAIKKRWENPLNRIKQSKLSKKLWEDDVYSIKTINNLKQAWTPERRKKQSEKMKEISEKNEYRKKMKEIMATLKNDPNWKAKQKEGAKKAWVDLNKRKKMSLATKKIWENNEERKRKVSEKMKGLWEDPIYRAKKYQILMKNNEKLSKAVDINGIFYKSLTEAAKALEVSVTEISASIKRKRKGYHLV